MHHLIMLINTFNVLELNAEVSDRNGIPVIYQSQINKAKVIKQIIYKSPMLIIIYIYFIYIYIYLVFELINRSNGDAMI